MTQLLARKWLDARGPDEPIARLAAASQILNDAGAIGRRVPIDVDALATRLGVLVRHVGHLAEEAQLLPVPGGFQILVDESLMQKKVRYRRAIVHEIVHTLFYTWTRDVAERILGPQEKKLRGREEQFASDVARRVLVPAWAIEDNSNLSEGTLSDAFQAIQSRFQVSHDVAAGTLIEDHAMFRAVAGRLEREGKTWKKASRTRFFASQSLTPRQRSLLWESAAARLRETPTSITEPWLVVNVSGHTAYVVAGVQPEAPEENNPSRVLNKPRAQAKLAVS